MVKFHYYILRTHICVLSDIWRQRGKSLRSIFGYYCYYWLQSSIELCTVAIFRYFCQKIICRLGGKARSSKGLLQNILKRESYISSKNRRFSMHRGNFSGFLPSFNVERPPSKDNYLSGQDSAIDPLVNIDRCKCTSRTFLPAPTV